MRFWRASFGAITSALLLVIGLLGSVACVEEEKTLGEEIEDVGEKLGEEAEEGLDEIEDELDDGADRAREALDDAKDAIEDAADDDDGGAGL